MPSNIPKSTASAVAVPSSRRSTVQAPGSLINDGDTASRSTREHAPTANPGGLASDQASSNGGSVSSMKTGHSARRASQDRTGEATPPNRRDNGTVAALPALTAWPKKKEYAYVWQCCACGRPLIPYSRRVCEACREVRCANCKVSKLWIK